MSQPAVMELPLEELVAQDYSEDELEPLEIALKEVTDLVAAKMAQSDLARQEVDRLYARWSVLKQNVVELRRRKVRIKCVLGDGSRILDLERVEAAN